MGLPYQSRYHVVEDTSDRPPPGLHHACYDRHDSSGVWNVVQAWFPFFAHAFAIVILPVSLVRWVDGHVYQTGSAPSLFAISADLYQTQVTGFLSLALVLVRFIAGICQGLLVWQMITVLLEKSGITLAELLRMNNYRFPAMFRTNHLSWSVWACAGLLLLWPATFSAPILNSALAWIPTFRLSNVPMQLNTTSVERFSDWPMFLYPDSRMMVVADGASFMGKSPKYAFDPAQPATQRYVPPLHGLSTDSRIDVTVPHFEVRLRWIDAPTEALAGQVGNSTNSDIGDPQFGIRLNGTVQVIREEPWEVPTTPPEDHAHFATAPRLLALKVGTITAGARLADGSVVDATTPCPRTSPMFGALPDVRPFPVLINFGGAAGETPFAATDCYLIGRADLTAGSYAGAGCTVTFADAATSVVHCAEPPGAVASAPKQPDYIAPLALDFVSNVLKYAVMLNQTTRWAHTGVDTYTRGMLRLGFHASWSALTNRLGNGTQPATARASEPVVRAVLDRTRVVVWVGMHLALTVAMVVVIVGMRASHAKTVRDPTLAAVTMDLAEVMHSGRADGLCNAVTLDRADHRLPLLRRREAGEEQPVYLGGSVGHRCSRRITFQADPDIPLA